MLCVEGTHGPKKKRIDWSISPPEGQKDKETAKSERGKKLEFEAWYLSVTMSRTAPNRETMENRKKKKKG
jgi:hypothetical protein